MNASVASALGVGLLAAAISAACTPPLRRWLELRRLLDQPGSRRSHRRPTPRGGGLAVMAALALVMLVWPMAAISWWPVMALVMSMAVLGWFDDCHDLAPGWRLLVQLLVMTAFVGLVGGIEAIILPGVGRLEQPLLWSVLAVVAGIWMINLHNFMDGSDGLAAMQAIWTGLVMGVLFLRAEQVGTALFAIALAGAYGGFLVWNRPPATVFMGDVGSLPLGAAVAGLAVLGAASGAVSVWLSAMVSAVFVADATVTLLSRAVRGERWYTAHRQHAYQRLIASGWSHGQVLGLYALVNICVVLPCVALGAARPQLQAMLAAGLTVLIALGCIVVRSATTNKKTKVEE